jgi:hypothetical protein
MITTFVVRSKNSYETVEGDFGLFNTTEEKYGVNFYKHIMEQYKLFVELMDRVTQRRLNTNTFFLTANTALIAALSGLSTTRILSEQNYIIIYGLAAVAGVLLCVEWRGIIKSYTQLNQGKFAIILQVESRLPLSMFKAEWKALGDGKNKKLYNPITKTERLIPIIFMFLYIALPVSSILIFSGLIP